MNARTTIPLRPDPAALARRQRRSVSRAILCDARAVFETDRSASRLVARDFDDDPDAAMILRAATSPTSTVNAPALMQQIISAVVLGASGAGAKLLEKTLTLTFAGAASITLPTFVADAALASFVGEGAPIPVSAPSIAAPSLVPHSIKSIFALTHEMITGSNAQALVEDCMRRSIGLALDASMFDANPATAIRPAGLRNGIAALTASTGPDAFESMLADISALLTAVAPVGGEAVIIASTARAAMIPLRARGGVTPLVLGSPAVAANDLIAVAVDGIAAAFTDEVELRSSREATVHMDSAPSPISTPGTPNVVSAPVASMFQVDAVATRMKLGVSWTKRHSASVAWTTTAW